MTLKNVWRCDSARRCAAHGRCQYPAGSSDSAAGAAGTPISTPSILRRRSVRGLRLTSCPVPAGDADSACLLYAAHSPLAGPRGRLPTESAHANCDGPSLPPARDSLTSLSARHYRRGALRRQRTPGPGPGHRVGCPQCWIAVYKLSFWLFSELCRINID